MFLLRAGFWIAVVVMLLPTDETNQQRLHHTAAATVSHVSTFCERNAGTCQTAGALWQTFLKKAEFGGRLALEMISGSRSQTETGAIQPARGGAPASGATSATGTGPYRMEHDAAGRSRSQRQGI